MTYISKTYFYHPNAKSLSFKGVSFNVFLLKRAVTVYNLHHETEAVSLNVTIESENHIMVWVGRDL